MPSPKIAILGISIEANNFAGPSSIKNFSDYAYLKGEEILTAGVIDYWLGAIGGKGFIPAMDKLREWTVAPILIADGQASGSVNHADYEHIKSELMQGLEAQLPVDAVYIVAHGAGRTTEIDDFDGDYFSAVRDIVGEEVPIVATLDLHANLTPKMISSCDALVSQRTNPHIDSQERAEDAAYLIHRMLDGWRPVQAASRLPLLTPQVSQLTDKGQPLGDIVERIESLIDDGTCIGASVIPGFSFSDTPENGFWLYAFGDDDAALNAALSTLSGDIWQDRECFIRETLPLEKAVEIAGDTNADNGPVIFADIADNPGGGGTGNTTWILDAFLTAGVKGGVFAPFVEKDLVKDAMEAGAGNEFLAVFNKNNPIDFSQTLSAKARVLWVGNGDYDSKYGVYAGSRVPLGPSCVLEISGIKVIVISVAQQLLGEDFITHFGVDVASSKFVVAKSRGHFRAGFSHIVGPEKIYEVDTLGLTTAKLANVPWRNISRPIEPLDEGVSYEPDVMIFPARPICPS